MGREKPAKDAASSGNLERGRSPLAVLRIKKLRDVSDSESRRLSRGEGDEEEEYCQCEKNGGKGAGRHWRRFEVVGKSSDLFGL